ncbi:protein tyrosine phosphatase family protein [Devosia sp. FKR38]|uniref:protein tyrosine phosphatase family protein n=1 Tax=Devosia sp. FKR38 TaxID=2562312 RepID=UPI0010BF8673|nr:protein tyrosine phosphatase family protein [Devosia sp. FKR38]
MTNSDTLFAAGGDPVEILNWRRVTPRLTTSGQPTEAQLHRLKALGVTQVINLGLHTHEKALPNEPGSLAALGIVYTHIPVEFTAPSDVDFERYCAVMAEAANEVIHVHCIYNARVSAFVYRQFRDRPDKARSAAIMESIWRPGGVWARFIGNNADAALPDRYAGRDY